MVEIEFVMVVEPSISSRKNLKETLLVDECTLANRKHDLNEVLFNNDHKLSNRFQAKVSFPYY